METSENLFHSIVETASDVLVAIDGSGKIIFWNRAAGTLFGYSAEEIKNKHLTDLMPERFRESHGKALSQAFSTGQSDLAGETFELKGCRRNGTEFPIELCLSPWKSGEEVFFTATIRDVTKRKPVEGALRESEAKYRLLIDSANNPITVYNSDGTLLLMNVTAATKLGGAPDDFVGKSVREVHPGIADMAMERIRQVIKSGESREFETAMELPSGKRWFCSNFQPVRDASGKILAVQIISYDITEHKRAEEALRESEEKYRQLVELSPDSIAIHREGKIVFINTAGARQLGAAAPEQLIGKSIMDFLHPDYHDVVKERIQRINKEEEEVPQIEEKIIRLDGTVIDVDVAVIPSTYQGKPAMLAIARDVTERKRAEEVLEETQEKLLRAERLAVLGQLAGGVGHELRNPLGAIKNATYFLNLVLEEPEPEVKKTLEILEKEVETSERITSSLLEFARPKPPIRRRVDLNKVVLEALSRVDVPENVKEVNQLDEVLPTILVDPDQLDQVFGNIIFNGIQAMPEGGRLTFKSEAPDPKRVTVSFTDTGEGIPDENLEKLFEPLFTTRARGIGLGLALARTLVVGHGGTIEVESNVGKGSTFTVRLPISREPATDSSTSLRTNPTEEESK